jgi:hypothetical protein
MSDYIKISKYDFEDLKSLIKDATMPDVSVDLQELLMMTSYDVNKVLALIRQEAAIKSLNKIFEIQQKLKEIGDNQ